MSAVLILSTAALAHNMLFQAHTIGPTKANQRLIAATVTVAHDMMSVRILIGVTEAHADRQDLPGVLEARRDIRVHVPMTGRTIKEAGHLSADDLIRHLKTTTSQATLLTLKIAIATFYCYALSKTDHGAFQYPAFRISTAYRQHIDSSLWLWQA